MEMVQVLIRAVWDQNHDFHLSVVVCVVPRKLWERPCSELWPDQRSSLSSWADCLRPSWPLRRQVSSQVSQTSHGAETSRSVDVSQPAEGVAVLSLPLGAVGFVHPPLILMSKTCDSFLFLNQSEVTTDWS